MPKSIVVSVLAKDKGYCLSFYLNCLLKQTFNKKHIHLYIRTNDNKDNTADILESFISKHGNKYASVHYDSSSIDDKIKSYKEHEWNSQRFNVLSKIRQESIDYAIKLNAHYFVSDCDNFIAKNVIESLYNDRSLGVIGPMLHKTKSAYYSNFHNVVDSDGYFQGNEMYYKILDRSVKGKIQVDVIHCTYFIDNRLLSSVSYDDGSNRHEYVVFSDNLRKIGVNQYLDNSKFYGFLFLENNEQDMFSEFIDLNWREEYLSMV